MEGKIRLKRTFENSEERRGNFNSIGDNRFKSIFSYMEKIEEE